MKYGEEDTSGILKVSGSEVLITDDLSSEAIYWAKICDQIPSSFHEFHNPYDAYDCTGAFTAVLPLLSLLNVCDDVPVCRHKQLSQPCGDNVCMVVSSQQ